MLSLANYSADPNSHYVLILDFSLNYYQFCLLLSSKNPGKIVLFFSSHFFIPHLSKPLSRLCKSWLVKEVEVFVT